MNDEQNAQPRALLSAQIPLDDGKRGSVTIKQTTSGVSLRLHLSKRTMAVNLLPEEVDAIVDSLGILCKG